MLRPALIALTLSFALPLSAQAQTADEQNFIDYQTALAIDDKCHFFRNFERQRATDVDEELVARLPFSTIGRQSEAFWIEYGKLVDQGRAKAATISCTNSEAAAPFIISLRDRFAHYLYADLMIAFESNRLTAEQREAAHAYEAMISPLYGENWDGFVQHASGRAQFRIDEANAQDTTTSPYSGLFEDLLGEYEYDYLFDESSADTYRSSVYLDALINRTIDSADTIVFEMIAEQAGYRIWSQSNAEGSGHVTTFVDGSGTSQYDLWQLPGGYVTLEKAGPVKLAFTIAQDGSVRIMSFGEQAHRLNEGSLTIAVHPGELPTNLSSDYAYIRSQEWWENANIYKAEPVDEPCLGGPCFALPADVIRDVLSGSYGQAFRFFTSITPDPAQPALDSSEIHIGFPYSLTARQTFLAAEAQ